MWTRELVKERAKQVLKINYWKALLVSLVIGIVTSDDFSNVEKSFDEFFYEYSFIEDGILSNLVYWTGTFFAFLASIALILFIFKILVGYMIEVGGRRFFIKAAEGETKMGCLGYCFKKGRYFGVLLTMLLRGIYIFLWTLLLVIPGIIKSYAYRMVPYILADNPSIGAQRAIELSNQMTDGEKMEMFVLDLSFIGWYILGLLALVVGIIFVNPYVYATEAELYLIIRKKVIENGLTSYEELNIVNYENNQRK